MAHPKAFVMVVIAWNLIFLSSLSANAEDAEAMRLVKQLAENKDLRLATEGVSAADRFALSVTIDVAGYSPMHLRVERNQQDVALLTRSADGLVYFYATNGLYVAIDAKQPNQFLIVPDVQPRFICRSDPRTAGMQFIIDVAREDAASVIFDPADLMSSLMASIRNASYQPDDRMLTILTRQAKVEAKLHDPAEAPFPLAEFTVSIEGRMAIRFHDIAIGAAIGESILGRTAKHFTDLPVKGETRPLTPQLAAAQPPVPARGFWDNQAAQETGKVLASVFGQGPQPATRPATQAVDEQRVENFRVAMAATRAGVAASLDSQEHVLARLELTAEQRRRIDELFKERRQQVEQAFARVREDSPRPGEALRQAAALGIITPRLQEILTHDQLVTFARVWMANNPNREERDSGRELLNTVLTEANKFDLSDLQRTELAKLFTDLAERWEEHRWGFAVGRLTERDTPAVVEEMKSRMVQGLQRILTREQYQLLEAGVLRSMQMQPTTQPGRLMPI